MEVMKRWKNTKMLKQVKMLLEVVINHNLIIISIVTILYRLVAFNKSTIQTTKISLTRQRNWKVAMTIKLNKKKMLLLNREESIKSMLLIKIILTLTEK